MLVGNIPFNFTVCREEFPAGKYIVKPVNKANPHILLVGSEDGRSVDMACTNDVYSSKAPAVGKLIFHRYGDQYFLAEAWMPGERVGSQLVKSEKEEALIKELSGKKRREKVTIKVVEESPPK